MSDNSPAPFFARTERFFVSLLLVIAVPVTTIVIGSSLIGARTMTQPNRGGTLTIAEMGMTDSINPLYCSTNTVNRTVCSLIFSGLTKIDPFSHEVKPDLAQKIEISNDLKTYTITLRDAYFHDNQPVTSTDVVFTYQQLLKDPGYDGPYKGAFNGITIEAKDKKTVTFKLPDINAFFPNSLTIGLVPEHILGSSTNIADFLSHPYNHNPIGTGMYQFASLNKNTSTEISLRSFSNYYSQSPYITNIHITGYSDSQALHNDASRYDVVFHDNETIDLDPSTYTSSKFILPQYVGIFFNTNTTTTGNKNVRLGIKVGTNRQSVVDAIPNNVLTDSPLPDILNTKINFDLEKGKALLKAAKVTPETPITLKVVYKDDPTLDTVAKELQKQWEPLGIKTNLIAQDFTDLQNNFLKTRDYDVLIIGERIGSNIDLYPYFHSSQLQYPGLNFPLYKNVAVDNLLDKIRLTIDSTAQKKFLAQAYEKISADMPMVPLYTPENTVYISKRVKSSFIPSYPTAPEQFFSLISSWYIAEKQIWI